MEERGWWTRIAAQPNDQGGCVSRADVKEAAALLLGGAGPVSAPQEAAAGHSSAAESGASEVGQSRE